MRDCGSAHYLNRSLRSYEQAKADIAKKEQAMAEIDFCVSFTPDGLNETGVRPCERGDRGIFSLEGKALVEWDEDRPVAKWLYPTGWALTKPRSRLVALTGPLADMALDDINSRLQDELWGAWRDSREGEEADYRYEAAE